jgi:cell division protein FtsA
LTGAAAKMPGTIDVAKRELKLPVQVGFPRELPFAVDKVDDPAFATAVGLVLWAAELQGQARPSSGKGFQMISGSLGKAKSFFKALLP